MKYGHLCIATILLMIDGALCAQEPPQVFGILGVERSHRDKTLAFGVHPFLSPRPQMIDGKRHYFRPDFFNQMIDIKNWSEISQLSGEYEMYFELLQGAKVFSDEVNLSVLGAALNSQNMNVTFQVGGARPTQGVCSGSGALSAQEDIGLLRTWQRNGGRIDKVIADNSFAKYYKAANPRCYASSEQLINLVAEELADYFSVMSQVFPGIKFGATDGFAQFRVTDDNGSLDSGSLTYEATVPMPEFAFKTYLNDLIKNMHVKGLLLDEFAMDCAEAYQSDASRYATSRYIVDSRNYGRIVAGDKVMKELHVASGIYWEVFPQVSGTGEQEKQYHDLGIQQIVSYYNFGRRPAHNRLVFWTDIPDVTGPEMAPFTALNDIRDDARVIADLDAKAVH